MSNPAASPHAAALLPGLIAGTLSPADRGTVLRHLAGCPACRAELAAWQAISDATRALYQDAPSQQGEFLRAVWQRIDAEANQIGTGTAEAPAWSLPESPRAAASLLPQPPAPLPPPAPWVASGAIPDRARHLPWPVATAMLILLMLVAGVLTWGPGRQDLAGLVVIPAVTVLPSTPDPAGIRAARLVEVTLPDALLVRGNGLGFGLSHDVIPPESETVSKGGYLRIEYVLRGTVGVRSEGPTQVVWAAGDGATETVPSGSEVSLGPGDTLLAPRAASTTYRNTAPTPVDLVTWGMAVNPESQSNQTPIGWVTYGLDLRPGSSLPPGPVRWRLERVDLPPGETLVPSPGALHQFVVVVSPAGMSRKDLPVLGRQGRDTFVNFGMTSAPLYVVTLEPEPATATPIPDMPAIPGGT